MHPKYQTAIELMIDVIAWQNVVEDAAARWDCLYDYIHENFDAPASSYSNQTFFALKGEKPKEVKQEIEECREMLRNHGAEELIARIEAIPPEYSDMIFPVAIARYLLRDCRVPIHPNMVKTFNEFHQRYGPMILGTIGL